MLAKIDHPQYHPTRLKSSVKSVKVPLKAQTETKQEWRGGAKVHKK